VDRPRRKPKNTRRVFWDRINNFRPTNQDYRRVLYTGWKTQFVLMTPPSGEEAGREPHKGDSALRFRGTLLFGYT
jgi:t-SNARE complex subunit (syntaxin)